MNVLRLICSQYIEFSVSTPHHRVLDSQVQLWLAVTKETGCYSNMPHKSLHLMIKSMPICVACLAGSTIFSPNLDHSDPYWQKGFLFICFYFFSFLARLSVCFALEFICGKEILHYLNSHLPLLHMLHILINFSCVGYYCSKPLITLEWERNRLMFLLLQLVIRFLMCALGSSQFISVYSENE